jgi:2-C-methyl-D-erythritol 2,4-cyclodiphosphate synthase
VSVTSLDIRIGIGADVHQFMEGRPLILGGVLIPYTKGLLGHSDADVVLHALTDAILGALAWGDIGSWFPDTDPAYQGADSAVLLEKVWRKVREEGWNLGNVDITVLLQLPKLRPYIDSIRKRISEILSVSIDKISVKASTTEKLGFVGREEGIFCEAAVILKKG